MNTMTSFFEWLVAASVRASALACIIFFLQLVLKRWLPARWRYVLWMPMVLVLIAPALPTSRFSMENRVPARLVVAKSITVQDVEATQANMQKPVVFEARGANWNLQRWLAVLWLAGTCGMLVAGGIGYYRNLRCIRRETIETNTGVNALVERIAGQLGLWRGPLIVMSRAIESPAVAGLFRPKLLLPATFSENFSGKEQHFVLLHELMHLKRHDLPVNWLLCLLQALHWFNPLLWFAISRMCNDRETACDAQVLATAGGDCRADYGHVLLKFQNASIQGTLSLAFVGIFERGAKMRSRIRAIAAYRSGHPVWIALVTIMIVGLILFGATKAQSKEFPVKENAPQIEINAVFITSSPGHRVEYPSTDTAIIQADKAYVADDELKMEGDRMCYTLGAEENKIYNQKLNQKGFQPLCFPSIITADGISANVTTERKVMVPKNDGKGFDPKSMGVSLEVRPKIVSDGIDLDIHATSSNVVDVATYRIVTDEAKDWNMKKVRVLEQKVESKQKLKDGDTLWLITPIYPLFDDSKPRLYVGVTVHVMKPGGK